MEEEGGVTNMIGKDFLLGKRVGGGIHKVYNVFFLIQMASYFYISTILGSIQMFPK